MCADQIPRNLNLTVLVDVGARHERVCARNVPPFPEGSFPRVYCHQPISGARSVKLTTEHQTTNGYPLHVCEVKVLAARDLQSKAVFFFYMILQQGIGWCKKCPILFVV